MNLLSLGIANLPAVRSIAPELIEAKGIETLTLDELIVRLDAAYKTLSGIAVTPESCMESPTVHSIVTNISRTIASLSVDVFERTVKGGRVSKEPLPNHPVARLLNQPNEWLTKTDYWQDATSFLLRYGRHFAFKARGQTGPIRRLVPIAPWRVDILQDDELNVTFHVAQANNSGQDYTFSQMHYARGPARDGLRGNSPVWDCREAIAAEIAAQRFGSSFFGNGAMPGLILKFAENFSAFKNDEEKNRFVMDLQTKFAGDERFSAMLLPKGIEVGQQLGVEPEKAQFVQTRAYLRTVICGAWGVPTYVSGDVEHQTFNNAEQQSINKSVEVSVPIAKIFESAMERDLLTDEDRRANRIIRFNIDAALRGDFKTRQDGLKIMRDSGIINANEWRVVENMNPREDQGGESYWDGGSSGQGRQQNPQGGSDAEPK